MQGHFVAWPPLLPSGEKGEEGSRVICGSPVSLQNSELYVERQIELEINNYAVFFSYTYEGNASMPFCRFWRKRYATGFFSSSCTQRFSYGNLHKKGNKTGLKKDVASAMNEPPSF